MENDYEFYYPGVYNEEDTKLLEEHKAKLDLINNRGDINIEELVNGKLKGTPGVMDRITKA